ncbi:bile acid:sodium symporter family protein [uncultured Selenomonas sp.]|uniref:bile acid:sodium symporter family protein n=1 Tax=uncultured Selenomonas sp. TaxID=159275 RepID=UPI0028F039A1|nr:bile acid:sodium symporter family protein [uncultured Selenomonas sp.]
MGGIHLQNIGRFIVKNMVWLVVLVGAAGAVFPASLSWIAPQVPLLLGIVMFGMGMTIELKDFRHLVCHPWDVGIGVLAQFTIMPLVAYLLTQAFSLSPDLAVGVILVGTCPGGTASNVITYLAKGDVALSVTMTMATTLLAPFITPFLTLLLAGEEIAVNAPAMMLSIAEMVLLPVLLGAALNHFFRRRVAYALTVLPLISALLVALLVGVVVSMSAPRLTEVGALVALAVVLHNGFGLVLGYALARLLGLSAAKRRAIGIEVGMQNSGMAASLALLYFNPAAAIPAALFSVWHNISGSLAANWFTRHDADESEISADVFL